MKKLILCGLIFVLFAGMAWADGAHPWEEAELISTYELAELLVQAKLVASIVPEDRSCHIIYVYANGGNYLILCVPGYTPGQIACYGCGASPGMK